MNQSMIQYGKATILTESDQEKYAMKMRVVMAGPLPPAVGGMATVIEDISKSSLSREVDLVLFNTAKMTPDNRTFWQGVVTRLSLWRKWWSVLKGADIVHIHTCSGFTYYLDGAYLCFAKLKRMPVVLHIHGAQFDKFLDSLSIVELAFARWLARRANRVVALSAEWKEQLEKRLPGSTFTIIENGVPVPDKIQRRVGEEKMITILFLGNLSQRKGVWELVEAMRIVDDSMKLVLAGGEEDAGIGEKVNREITEAGLSKKIEWLGPVFGEDKRMLLQNSDLYVLPSRAEGLPISLLEAMCAGLPVVATTVGAIPSVIEDGKQGFLISPGDSKALADALTRLAYDKKLRSRLGKAARSRCAECYGVERAVKNYLRLYGDLIVG